MCKASTWPELHFFPLKIKWMSEYSMTFLFSEWFKGSWNDAWKQHIPTLLFLHLSIFSTGNTPLYASWEQSTGKTSTATMKTNKSPQEYKYNIESKFCMSFFYFSILTFSIFVILPAIFRFLGGVQSPDSSLALGCFPSSVTCSVSCAVGSFASSLIWIWQEAADMTA